MSKPEDKSFDTSNLEGRRGVLFPFTAHQLLLDAVDYKIIEVAMGSAIRLQSEGR